MAVIFFTDQLAFRQWLEENHTKETELLVGFYKINSGKKSINWSEAVDQALCFGWIDGVRKSIDKDSYCIRFTPRRPSSIWSQINLKKVDELIKQGLMQPSGMAIYEQRNKENSKIYSFENELKTLSDNLENRLKTHAIAWNFFNAQSSSFQKKIIHWIMTAKQEKTKLARLEKFIADSETKDAANNTNQ